MQRVEGKVAVVTGGALGIGRACVLLLAKEGAKVAVTDIKDEEGQKVVDEIEKSRLASDESKFVTGSEQVIDGGYTAQ